MIDAKFEKWLALVHLLNESQRVRAFQALTEAAATTESASSGSDGGPSHDVADCDGVPMPPAQSALDECLLDKLGRERVESFGCPHCSSAEVGRWCRAGGKPRYRCAHCRKTFHPLTGTPLSGLHFQERWKDQAQALIVGETVSKAARRYNVACTTAFR